MKLPLSWLRDHLDTDLAADDIIDVMSGHGLEVESVTTPGAGTAGVRTARVLHWEPHPDADRLRVVRVTGDGGQGEVELVCGAANFDVGDVVAHAPPGGSIPGMTLERRKIRGVVSNGMLASARELEIGDDHAGILVLPKDTPLGQDLTDLLPLGEPVIEVAVQPDRGDHLSVLGVARDLAAILDTTWHAPEVPAALDAPSLPVDIDTDGCERFVTWSLEDVVPQPSPPWLQQRLAQCGIRAIDVVVDVTNYVMLELGQPLHAFDLEALRGPSLRVRRAAAGETLTTLDDKVRSLEAGDLVIEDAQRLVSLAGVMGGLDTEVTADTRRVLVEAAVWEPASIRATSRRLGLVSEASQRFERGVDPEGAGRAAARAVGLLTELAGARATGTGHAQAARDWAVRPVVRADPARVQRLLAVDGLDADAQAALLRRSGCEVTVTDGHLDVQPPSWRADLTREADVAEEVARLHGYESIPAVLPPMRVAGRLTPAQRGDRQVRAVLAARGFHEAVLRPFVGQDCLLGVVPTEGRVVLGNPLAQDASAMRPSLLEGLVTAVRRNVGQGRAGTAIGELGRIFRPVDDPLGKVLSGLGVDPVAAGWQGPDGTPLPLQPRTLGVAAQGLKLGDRWLRGDARWSVYDVLGLFDDVVDRLAPPDAALRLERVPAEREGFHPGRTAALHLGHQEIGVVGQLHPTLAARLDLPEPVILGELLLEGFWQTVPDMGHPPVPAQPLHRHPALSIDVALVADDAIPYAVLEEAVRQAAGELLDGLWWFDEYRGEQVGEGRRSVAIRLRLQAPDRQLTDADAEQVIDRVAAEAARVGATLRR